VAGGSSCAAPPRRRPRRAPASSAPGRRCPRRGSCRSTASGRRRGRASGHEAARGVGASEAITSPGQDRCPGIRRRGCTRNARAGPARRPGTSGSAAARGRGEQPVERDVTRRRKAGGTPREVVDQADGRVDQLFVDPEHLAREHGGVAGTVFGGAASRERRRQLRISSPRAPWRSRRAEAGRVSARGDAERAERLRQLPQLLQLHLAEDVLPHPGPPGARAELADRASAARPPRSGGGTPSPRRPRSPARRPPRSDTGGGGGCRSRGWSRSPPSRGRESAPPGAGAGRISFAAFSVKVSARMRSTGTFSTRILWRIFSPGDTSSRCRRPPSRTRCGGPDGAVALGLVGGNRTRAHASSSPARRPRPSPLRRARRSAGGSGGRPGGCRSTGVVARPDQELGRARSARVGLQVRLELRAALPHVPRSSSSHVSLSSRSPGSSSELGIDAGGVQHLLRQQEIRGGWRYFPFSKTPFSIFSLYFFPLRL